MLTTCIHILKDSLTLITRLSYRPDVPQNKNKKIECCERVWDIRVSTKVQKSSAKKFKNGFVDAETITECPSYIKWKLMSQIAKLFPKKVVSTFHGFNLHFFQK